MDLKKLDILVNLQNRPDFLKTGETREPIKYTWVQHLETMGLVSVEVCHEDVVVGTSRTVKTDYKVTLTEKGRQAFTPVAQG